MKKLLFILFFVFLFLIGCDNTINTPTNRVKAFFGKYQSLDKEVVEDLNTVIDKESSLSKEEKKEYKELFLKQYQNLSYKIKSEEINGNMAFIEVEIEVLDYGSALNKSKKKQCKDSVKCKIKEMKNIQDKKKSNIVITVTKEEGIWKIIEPNDNIIKKIHGF